MDKQEIPPDEETNLTPAQLAAAAGAAPVTEREIDEDDTDDEDDGVIRTHARTRDPLLEEDGGKSYLFFEEMLWDVTTTFHPITLRNMRSVISAALRPNDPGLPEFRNILTLDSVRAMNEALSYLGDTDMEVVANPLIASSTAIVELVEDWLFYRGIVGNITDATEVSISDALNEENALRAIGQMAVILAFPVECRVALAMRYIIANGKSGILIPAAAAVDAGRGKAAPQETIPHTVGAVVSMLIANQTVGKRIEGLTGPMADGDERFTVESILNYEVPMNRDDVMRFLVGILYGSERIDPDHFPLMLIEKKKNQRQPQQQQNNRHQQRGGKRHNNRSNRGGGGGATRG